MELSVPEEKVEPLNMTLAPGSKFVPVIVTISEEPLGALVGVIDVMVGGGGCVEVRLNAVDVPAGAGSIT